MKHLPTCAGASRQALHRCLAVPEPERRPRAGVLRRRHGGGHHLGLVAHSLAVRHRAQLELHLQGPGGGREAGGPRAGRALRAGRQRAQGGEPGAHHGAAHRRDDRGRISGRTVSKAPSTTSSSCRISCRRASSARSRRSWSGRRSNARSGSRPKALTPTTTTCAAWRTCTREPGRPSTRRCRRSTGRSSSIRISRRPTGWRRGAISGAKINGWMTDRAQEIAEGARLARRAVELGKDDAVALARSGHALGHLAGDLDGGIALLDRALVLNPNLASAWFLGGFLRVWRGEPDGAIEHFARAMRLSPLDPEMYRMQAGMALAHLLRRALRHGVVMGGEGIQGFAELPDGGRHHRGKPCACRPDGRSAASDAGICASSIPRCASPISGIGSRSAGRKISPRSRTACEEQGCRSDGGVIAPG